MRTHRGFRIGRLRGLFAAGFGLVLVAKFPIHHIDLSGLRRGWLQFLNRPYTVLRFATMSLALALSLGGFFLTPTARAASAPNPTVGGPYDSLPTHVCSNLGNAYCYASKGSAPVSAAAEVLPYMDNAARNWGCQWQPDYHAPEDLGKGNWSKWYGSEADRASGCGLVFWNHARQAAFFLANADEGGTSARLLHRYTELGAERGSLGYPISNPTPFGGTEVTYQQFANGLVTYVSGDDSAFHVDGTTPEDRALAAKYADHFGVSPTSGPAVHGLAQEVGCTNSSGAGCGAGRTGRYLEWWDAAQRLREMIVARTGSTTALHVSAPILSAWTERYGATDPWNGALGFPITDLLPTGSATWHQEFETGTILWEPGGCSSGAYTARVVPQFRRPITEDNLTMLCEASPPANDQFAPVSAPVPFAVAAGRGTYTFHGGVDASGWYEGVAIQFDGAAPIQVNSPFYSAWVGSVGRDGNVADALAMVSTAGGWGPPTGNATCDGSPCLVMRQIFANGVATIKTGGIVGWAPVSPGLLVPIGFQLIERGYTTPPPPADPRDPIGPRSGDYIKLVWLNKATAAGVTTRLYRSVTPLNGAAGPLTLIHTYPPPTFPVNTGTVFTDYGPTNNAKNCYALSVSDADTERWAPQQCTFTLDGTVDANGIDHSIPRGVSRAQVRIGVPTSPGDSATLKPVGVRLVSLAGGFDFNMTLVDSTNLDFALGSSRPYDLRLDGIGDVADIDGIVIESYGDNLRVGLVELILNNVTVFSKSFNPPVLVSNSHFLGGTRLEIGFDELRSNELWDDIYATSPALFLGFDRTAFRSKLDSLLGHLVYTTPGAGYYGSRLRDGYTTHGTKPAGFQRDRLHVRQHIIADAHHGINCSLDYDLRLTARDINGNSVSPFFNGPAAPGGTPIIFTTEIHLENPHVDCGSGFWDDLFYTLLTLGGYQFTVGDLEDDIQQSLNGQGPSQIQSAPPPHMHFCFPGTNEGLGGEPFRFGGFTVCGD